MTGNTRLIVGLAAVLCVAAVAGILLVRSAPQPAVPSPAGSSTARAPIDHFVAIDPAVDFAAAAPLDPAGKPADMAAYRGKALLVNFWATWCAPCIEELPALGKLQTALGGADFAVVTIALDEPDPTKIAPFLETHGAGNLPALIDSNRTIDKVTPVAALPTSLLVDKAGKVRATLTGDAEWDCGAALAAVKAFIADGTVSEDELAPCS